MRPIFDRALEQAKQHLILLESGHEIDRVVEPSWNLPQLPEGTRHWYMVIVAKGTLAGDMKGYHVFWCNGNVDAQCKSIHSVDFASLNKLLRGDA